MKEDAINILRRVAADPSLVDYELSQVNKVLSKSPGDVDYLLVKGNLLDLKGQGLHALQSYKIAEEIEPHNIEVLFNVADYYGFIDDHEKAHTAFMGILELIQEHHNNLLGNVGYVVEMIKTYSEINNDLKLKEKVEKLLEVLPQICSVSDDRC